MARVVALLAIALFVGACATPGGYSGVPGENRAERLAAAGDHDDAARVYFGLAAEASPQERDRLTMLAVEQWLDAGDINNLIEAARGCDLIVNGLPLDFNLPVMEAALAVNASYFDMAGPMEDIGFVESYKLLFSQWHERFKTKGLTALVGGGSSPGLANVMARGMALAELSGRFDVVED